MLKQYSSMVKAGLFDQKGHWKLLAGSGFGSIPVLPDHNGSLKRYSFKIASKLPIAFTTAPAGWHNVANADGMKVDGNVSPR